MQRSFREPQTHALSDAKLEDASPRRPASAGAPKSGDFLRLRERTDRLKEDAGGELALWHDDAISQHDSLLHKCEVLNRLNRLAVHKATMLRQMRADLDEMSNDQPIEPLRLPHHLLSALVRHALQPQEPAVEALRTTPAAPTGKINPRRRPASAVAPVPAAPAVAREPSPRTRQLAQSLVSKPSCCSKSARESAAASAPAAGSAPISGRILSAVARSRWIGAGTQPGLAHRMSRHDSRDNSRDGPGDAALASELTRDAASALAALPRSLAVLVRQLGATDHAINAAADEAATMGYMHRRDEEITELRRRRNIAKKEELSLLTRRLREAHAVMHAELSLSNETGGVLRDSVNRQHSTRVEQRLRLAERLRRREHSAWYKGRLSVASPRAGSAADEPPAAAPADPTAAAAAAAAAIASPFEKASSIASSLVKEAGAPLPPPKTTKLRFADAVEDGAGAPPAAMTKASSTGHAALERGGRVLDYEVTEASSAEAGGETPPPQLGHGHAARRHTICATISPKRQAPQALEFATRQAASVKEATSEDDDEGEEGEEASEEYAAFVYVAEKLQIEEVRVPSLTLRVCSRGSRCALACVAALLLLACWLLPAGCCLLPAAHVCACTCAWRRSGRARRALRGAHDAARGQA